MDRLESVADVGQGAADNDAHRVVEVARPELVLDADGQYAPCLFSHSVFSDYRPTACRCRSPCMRTAASDKPSRPTNFEAISDASLVDWLPGARRTPASVCLISAASGAGTEVRCSFIAS